MRKRSRTCEAFLLLLSCLPMVPFMTGGAVAADRSVLGKLTDPSGAVIAGATVLIFPADERVKRLASEDSADAASDRGARDLPADGLQLRSDADGGFAARLAPGRYVFAAVKRGYEISVTEVYVGADRFIRQRLVPVGATPAEPPPAEPDLGPGWFIRQQRADVLHDEGATLPVAIALAPAPSPLPESEPHPGLDRARAFLGSIDGDFTHSLGAGDLIGLMDSSGTGQDAARATALGMRAHLNPELAWNVVGHSTRTHTELPDASGRLAGGSDSLTVGADYAASARPLQGSVRAGFTTDLAGEGEVAQRVLEGEGSIGVPGGDHRIAVAVRAWSGQADLTGGGALTLSPEGTGPASTDGEGLSLYAGDGLPLDPRTHLDYGIEYRSPTSAADGRLVPRLGVTRRLSESLDIAVRSQLILDPESPGGRLEFQGAPSDRLRIAASVSVLPAYAAEAPGDLPTGPGTLFPVRPPSQISADSREVAMALSGDFKGLTGSLSGSIGRTGRRALPYVVDGPAPVVSLGEERFYETRIGLAYRPWDTRMDLGFRRVGPQDDEQGTSESAASEYRQIDLTVSQALPSPRSLLGARLRALVAWQGLAYDSLYATAGGAALSGLTSRLTGGVGLSF